MFGSSSFNTQQQNNTGLFGNNTTSSTGGLFGQQATQQSTSGSLFGGNTASVGGFGGAPSSQFGSQGQNNQSSISLFGTATTTSAQSNQPSIGGLFGANNQSTQSSGGLFSSNSQSTQPSGGLFGQNTTSAIQGTNSTNPMPSSSGSLFGSTSAPQSTPSTGGLFGSGTTQSGTSSLFSGQGNQPSATPGTSFFGASSLTTSTNASIGGNLFGGSVTASGSGVGLFGNSATPASSNTSGISTLGASTQPLASSQPVGTGLFGTSATAAPNGTGGLLGSTTTSTTPGLSAGSSATTGGLFGAPSSSSQPTASIFGNAASSTTTSAQAGSAGVSVPPSGGSLSQVKANLLEHRPIEEVLANWEGRIAQQASIFHKFAGDVVSVDKQLIQSARRLKELSDEHLVLKQKSAHVDAAIKSIWDHQDALGKLLTHIQDELNRDRASTGSQFSGSALSATGSASERGAAVWSQILDMEAEVSDLVRDIESISSGTGAPEESNQGNLCGLVKLIKLHAHSIANLQQQTNDARRSLQSL